MFPWNKSPSKHMNDWMKNMNPKEVEEYVNQVMNQIFGSSFPFESSSISSPIIKKEEKQQHIDIFETKEYVYVTVAITEEQKRKMKIQHNSHLLYLVNYPKQNDKKKVMLPSPVKRKGTKVYIRDGKLEIKLIKLEDHQFSEIEISPTSKNT